MIYRESLNAREAAEYLGISYEAFKKAVTRSALLREGRHLVSTRLYLYPLTLLRAWDELERRRAHAAKESAL